MRGLALDYLSKMKIAVMVRQLDLRHILWCGRVVRVERAPRVRVVRGVQKMPDVGNGVIGFDHVRFHVRDLVMAFLEDELVRCCATHWIIDLESFEDNVSKLTNYCYDEKNFKVPIMEAIVRVVGK